VLLERAGHFGSVFFPVLAGERQTALEYPAGGNVVFAAFKALAAKVAFDALGQGLQSALVEYCGGIHGDRHRPTAFCFCRGAGLDS
jgi:hypothetical protein